MSTGLGISVTVFLRGVIILTASRKSIAVYLMSAVVNRMEAIEVAGYIFAQNICMFLRDYRNYAAVVRREFASHLNRRRIIPIGFITS